MEIFLIRHGHAAGNPYEEPDYPAAGYLSLDGESQAELLREELRDYDISLIWTSKLGRALRTAAIALDHRQIPLRHFAFLNEWMPNKETRTLDSSEWEKMNASAGSWEAEETWKTELGEGCLDFLARVGPPFLKELATVGVHARHGGFVISEEAENLRLAVVAHGGTLSALLGFLLGLPPFPVGGFNFQLTSVAQLHFKKQGSVSYPQLVIPAHHLK